MWPNGAPGPRAVLPVPDDRDPLTISEVARLVDLDPPDVSRAIARGELHAFTQSPGVRRWVWRCDVAAGQARPTTDLRPRPSGRPSRASSTN